MHRELRINEQIKTSSLRVIDVDGQQLGILPVEKALQLARSKELDLVEVAPGASPPVCRIMEYSKYKYDQEKKEREARKRQRLVHLKEIKLKPKIEEHDYQVKLHHAERFLKRGNKVKITLFFRGRELEHPEIGRRVFDRLTNDLSGLGQIERGPVLEGRIITLLMAPK